MSQFSTMTTRERKMQAAAICREVQGPEDIQMDLGKKVSTPKDIMLDELSFTSNRGSRLFKMRQRRSEKYTFESIQNETNTQIHSGMVLESENGSATENLGVEQPTETTPARTEPSPDSIAPGYGGPLKNVPPERFNSTSIPKSYHSPWDQAIISDPALADTLITRMPEPEPRPELPGYKSFNRVATPFGGFGKAPGPPTLFRTHQGEPLSEYPELQGEAEVKRPSFNRAPVGWVSTGPAAVIPTISLEPTFVPESDDL